MQRETREFQVREALTAHFQGRFCLDVVAAVEHMSKVRARVPAHVCMRVLVRLCVFFFVVCVHMRARVCLRTHVFVFLHIRGGVCGRRKSRRQTHK